MRGGTALPASRDGGARPPGFPGTLLLAPAFLAPGGAAAALNARAGLRDIVAVVEAGPAGYDAVVYGATVPPPKPPTRMTLDGIATWTARTPGQNHAIGRYQIVPKTLRRLVRTLGLDGGTRFSPAVQDRMADRLLHEAGLPDFLAGRMTRAAFMQRLAGIWAGLPGRDGRSVHAGIGGNRAGFSWAEYRAHMARVFPE